MPYPRDEYPEPRPYVCNGSHSSQRVVTGTFTVEGAEPAEITIHTCMDPTCAKLSVECEHQNNQWNEDNTVLSCKFCGIDGT